MTAVRLGSSSDGTLGARLLPSAHGPSSSSAVCRAIPLQTFRLASSTPPNAASESASAAPSTKELAQSSSSTDAVSASDPLRAAVPATASTKPSGPPAPFHTRAWATIKKEAAHYWAGTRLLGKEVRISTSLAWKVLNGNVLTRRERRQVSRDDTVMPRFGVLTRIVSSRSSAARRPTSSA